MPLPLDELNAQIEELQLDCEFVQLALQLKPRIGSVLQWQSQGEELELAKRFMGSPQPRPESIYGPLLVRLLANFERFIRQLVAWAVDERASAVPKYDDLADSLAMRNLVLTGKMLSTLDSPLDHLVIDLDLLIGNLASCRRGNTGAVQLNAPAFSAAVSGVSPANIEKGLEYVDVKNWWDTVGAIAPLVAVLGTKGARETGSRARQFLKELSRQRNQLAHGGDGSVSISESQLRDAINFIAAFSKALNGVVVDKVRH